LGGIHRRRRQTWVDGAEYGSEKEAAAAAGVAVSSVCEALKAGGRTVKGHVISPEAPRKPQADRPPEHRKRMLLRYPPGEGPLYSGSRRWV
jgi:hypothetical protein